MTKWFINSNNYIKGPFSSEEVKAQMSGFSEQMHTTFLWSRGHTEWIRADKWIPELNTLQPSQMQNTVTSSEEVTFVPQAKPTLEPAPKVEPKSDLVKSVKNSIVEKFRVQYDLIDKGEMTKEELTAFTAKQEDVAKISVFDKKTSEWKEIYSMTDVVQRLGLTRRGNQRVPILAQFSGIQIGSEAKINARVITISRGGIGITDNFELKLGETIQGQLTSPHFYSPVNTTAEVTYAGLDGYVGLKFVNMNDEMMAHVLDYVKRFGKDSEET
jgi:polyhydroxyalkanoate synthesis regulator phasin